MSEAFEAGAYRFAPVVPEDLGLLRAWLAQPHVAEWWGDPDHEVVLIREGLELGWVESWLVSTEDRPFAYVQTWDVHGEPAGSPFPDQPPGTLGIDPFIGPPERIGRGHGSAFLGAFMGHGFERGVPRFVIDPDPANARAIAAYARAGFIPQGERDTVEGRVLFMVRESGRFRTMS